MTLCRTLLSKTGVLMLSGALTFWIVLMVQNAPPHSPVVALRLSQYLESAPSRPGDDDASVYAMEDNLGPRTLLDRWNPLVREAAEKFHVPAVWLRAVMRNETGGRTVQENDRPITSQAGAQGVMQLMPDTYSQMADQHRLGQNPFNPRDNVFAAAAYLRWLKDRYGFPGMFAAYNVGPRNWDLYRRRQRGLPLETRNYVRQITAYLKDSPASIVNAVHLTRPDGRAVAIDTSAITAVTPAREEEYAPGARAVIFMHAKRQAVRENVAMVFDRLRVQGVAL